MEFTRLYRYLLQTFDIPGDATLQAGTCRKHPPANRFEW